LGGLRGVGDPGNAGAGRAERRWRDGRWRQLFLICVVCLALLLPRPGLGGQALAISWPRRPAPAAAPESLGLSSTQRLQEVPPPAAVQQLQEALADRAPQVRILAPAADAVLPGEPWTLRLQVDDWPLVDGGALGLGPHLLVQIDGEEPQRLTGLETTLPPLSPGSHRLTVVAARPWGEVVKSPGALAQIRLHRTAPNPLSLPAVGSPQLLPVSPPAAAAGEPLLLDWLLVDAPLQHLRDDDARWRLRVTVNGDSFLVDRQTPLWLRGWRPGTNALQLELLDGRGEPLNPPFNSLVQEVRLDAGQPRPAWLGGRLSASDLAILLGQAPAVAAPELGAPEEPISDTPATEASPPDTGSTDAGGPETAASQERTTPEETTPEATTQEKTEQEKTEQGETDQEQRTKEKADQVQPTREQADQAVESALEPVAEPSLPPAEPSMPVAELPIQAESGEGDPDEPARESVSQDAPPSEQPPSPPEQEEGETAPSLRPAREEVNPDGTLRREPRRSPLAGLRERLAG
jgi:hypothetical protein